MKTEQRKTMLAIYTTYPVRPTSAVEEIVQREPIELSRFESIESAFRGFAESLGWKHPWTRFVKKYEDYGGVRKNTSYLLIPSDDGNGAYYRIAFYS